MSASIHMRHLQHASEPLYTEFWLPLYRNAFPENERITEQEIEQGLDDPNTHIVVGCTAEGRPVSMAYCVVCTDEHLPPSLYLIYLATLEQERGKGWGGQLFELLTALERQSETPPQVLFLEAQDVAEAAKISEAEKTDAIRRMRFYEKHGCLLLQGSHYVQRVAGFEGIVMQLLYRSFNSSLTAETAFKITQTTFGKDDVTQIGPLLWSKPTDLTQEA